MFTAGCTLGASHDRWLDLRPQLLMRPSIQVEQPSTLQLSVVLRWLKSRGSTHARPVVFSLALQTRTNSLSLSQRKVATGRRRMMMRRAYTGSS